MILNVLLKELFHRLGMNKFQKAHTGQVIFFTALVINLLVLDWVVLTDPLQNKYLFSEKQVVNQPTLIPTIVPTETPSQTPTPEVSQKQTNETLHTITTREIYIPLGSGSSKSSSWDSLEGIEVNIDTSRYGVIKEAYFQAALRIPTANGQVYAKLYNETDKHDVWFSEVSTEGATGVVKEAKITIDKGAKLYRVYLKSTLEVEAILDLARIKLIVEE